MTRLTRVPLALLATLVLGIACAESPTPTAPTALGAPSIAAGTVLGEDDGELYAIHMPERWNGDLVLVAHGLVDPVLPVGLPNFTVISDLLMADGYAVAYSSFKENGWAIKDGAQRTHALLDRFSALHGAPRRVFATGQSMGGLIALKLAEQHPNVYAGVFSFCGATGGTTLRIRYAMDVRALFDVFYRKADGSPLLPGDATHVDRATVDLERDIRAPALAAMAADMSGATIIAKVARTPVPFGGANPQQELRNAIAEQLFRHARQIDDAMARGHGESAIDNRDVRYAGAGIDAATEEHINRRVQRFGSSRYAEATASRYYDPEGSLRIPMMSLRTTRDPALPAALNDDVYLAKLTPRQRELVTVRTVNRFGHCNILPADLMAAFRELAARAEGAGRSD